LGLVTNLASQVEIRRGRRVVERFLSDIDPDDESECIALLRRRARELAKPVEELTLRTWAAKRRRREYRA
jgi:hypothetical protein